MKILFLGPSCESIEEHLFLSGHFLMCTEKKFSINFLQEQNFDFCISYRYKEIIRKAELDYFGEKIINLHISLLPFNRGCDPNLWSYIDNTLRGVTIHLIDEGIDTGAILLQKIVDIDMESDTLKSSFKKLSNAIEFLFIQNSERILKGEIVPVPQEGKGTFHLSRDKNKILYLIEELWWETPVAELIFQGNKNDTIYPPPPYMCQRKDNFKSSWLRR